MPTYAQLEAEPWWNAETIPPNLRILVEKLQAHYRLGWSQIGCRGDENHLRGYHRSRAWILNSRYCTNRTYSVSRTPGDKSGGDPDWLCAIDATLPRAELIAACQRLDAAVRAGRLEKVTEWYGNDDGDSRVDGYDNIANAVASSDDSHLWHLHISFDRGRADEDHSDLLAILTGDDMPTPRELWTADGWLDYVAGPDGKRPPLTPIGALFAARADAHYGLAKLEALTAVIEQLAAAITAGGGTVDTAAVLAGVDERLAALRTQVESDTRDAVADLAEGGADAVRADSE